MAGVSGSRLAARQERVREAGGGGGVSSPCGFWDGVGASASTPHTSWVGGRVGNCREEPGAQSGLKGKATRARMGYRKSAVTSVKPEHMPEHI